MNSFGSSNGSGDFLPSSLPTSNDSSYFYGALRENIVALLLGLIIFTTSFAILKSITSPKNNSLSPSLRRRSLKLKVQSEFMEDEFRIKDSFQEWNGREGSIKRPSTPVNLNSSNFEGNFRGIYKNSLNDSEEFDSDPDDLPPPFSLVFFILTLGLSTALSNFLLYLTTLMLEPLFQFSYFHSKNWFEFWSFSSILTLRFFLNLLSSPILSSLLIRLQLYIHVTSLITMYFLLPFGYFYHESNPSSPWTLRIKETLKTLALVYSMLIGMILMTDQLLFTSSTSLPTTWPHTSSSSSSTSTSSSSSPSSSSSYSLTFPFFKSSFSQGGHLENDYWSWKSSLPFLLQSIGLGWKGWTWQDWLSVKETGMKAPGLSSPLPSSLFLLLPFLAILSLFTTPWGFTGCLGLWNRFQRNRARRIKVQAQKLQLTFDALALRQRIEEGLRRESSTLEEKVPSLSIPRHVPYYESPIESPSTTTLPSLTQFKPKISSSMSFPSKEISTPESPCDSPLLQNTVQSFSKDFEKQSLSSSSLPVQDEPDAPIQKNSDSVQSPTSLISSHQSQSKSLDSNSSNSPFSSIIDIPISISVSNSSGPIPPLTIRTKPLSYSKKSNLSSRTPSSPRTVLSRHASLHLASSRRPFYRYPQGGNSSLPKSESLDFPGESILSPRSNSFPTTSWSFSPSPNESNLNSPILMAQLSLLDSYETQLEGLNKCEYGSGSRSRSGSGSSLRPGPSSVSRERIELWRPESLNDPLPSSSSSSSFSPSSSSPFFPNLASSPFTFGLPSVPLDSNFILKRTFPNEFKEMRRLPNWAPSFPSISFPPHSFSFVLLSIGGGICLVLCFLFISASTLWGLVNAIPIIPSFLVSWIGSLSQAFTSATPPNNPSSSISSHELHREIWWRVLEVTIVGGWGVMNWMGVCYGLKEWERKRGFGNSKTFKSSDSSPPPSNLISQSPSIQKPFSFSPYPKPDLLSSTSDGSNSSLDSPFSFLDLESEDEWKPALFPHPLSVQKLFALTGLLLMGSNGIPILSHSLGLIHPFSKDWNHSPNSINLESVSSSQSSESIFSTWFTWWWWCQLLYRLGMLTGLFLSFGGWVIEVSSKILKRYQNWKSSSFPKSLSIPILPTPTSSSSPPPPLPTPLLPLLPPTS